MNLSGNPSEGRKRETVPTPPNHQKVIDLATYRSKRPVCYEPKPETIVLGDNIEELIRQGRYQGTYTPAAPYGENKENEGDA